MCIRDSFTEGRIQDIESKLANSEIVDISKIPPGDKVVFGALVSIINTENDELREYRIVGDDEADVSQGKISYKSPIARALIGKEIGDIAVVQAPSGEIEYGITGAQITMKAMFFNMLDQGAANAVNNAFWRTGCAA